MISTIVNRDNAVKMVMDCRFKELLIPGLDLVSLEASENKAIWQFKHLVRKTQTYNEFDMIFDGLKTFNLIEERGLHALMHDTLVIKYTLGWEWNGDVYLAEKRYLNLILYPVLCA